MTDTPTAAPRPMQDLLLAADAARKANRPGEAANLMLQAIARGEETREPMPRTLVQDTAVLLFRLERIDEAEALLERGLAKRPKDFDLLNTLGVVQRRRGRLADALKTLERAEKADPKNATSFVNRGNIYGDLGDTPKALAMFEQATKLKPKDAEVRRLYGNALRTAGQLDAAGRQLELARQTSPTDLRTWLDLSWFYEETGKGEEGLALVDKAIEKFGIVADLVRHRAVFLRRHGQHDKAKAWLQGLVSLGSQEPMVFLQLAHTVAASDRAGANPLYREVLKRTPNDIRVMVSFADNLQRTRGPDEAKHIDEAYHLALKILESRRYGREHLKELRDIFIRCADYESAEKLGSFTELGETWAKGNTIAALHLMMGQLKTDADRHNLLAWHIRCGEQVERLAARTPLPASPPVTGRAKIRIGFMSSDLRDHPVSYFVAPFIERYDRSRFELYCYSWYTRDPDPVQQALAKKVDAFRHVRQIGKREAAELIAGDQLDMLFELGGSTDMNKLEVMAFRPAPRQASWLGYPHSAGYATIDRLLVDPYTKPADLALMMEKPFELAHSWVTFDRLGFGKPTDIDPVTPQERNGRVTFGTMNNPMKYNVAVFETWAECVARVPGSRFLFVRPEGNVPAFRDNIAKVFATKGVSADRIEYIPIRGNHLQHYNAIDVSLDAFPQTGGTTTCETLYMGTPVVSLVGPAFFERLSYSNLSNAGLGDLCAFDKPTFIEKAVALAGNTAWRTEYRRTAREQIKANPLGNAALFTRDFENAATAWMDETR